MLVVIHRHDTPNHDRRIQVTRVVDTLPLQLPHSELALVRRNVIDNVVSTHRNRVDDPHNLDPEAVVSPSLQLDQRYPGQLRPVPRLPEHTNSRLRNAGGKIPRYAATGDFNLSPFAQRQHRTPRQAHINPSGGIAHKQGGFQRSIFRIVIRHLGMQHDRQASAGARGRQGMDGSRRANDLLLGLGSASGLPPRNRCG
jgi:hypothetical protein